MMSRYITQLYIHKQACGITLNTDIAEVEIEFDTLNLIGYVISNIPRSLTP